MRGRTVTALLVVAAGAAGLAVAEAPHPMLHEDFLPAGATPAATPTIGGTRPGSNPQAIITGDKRLPKPSLSPDPDTSSPKPEPVLGKGGFATDRDTTLALDNNTGADPTLHYASVFNPDVLPFKRMSALDGVAPDYTMVISHDTRVGVPVGGTTDTTRDRFWGSVLVDLEPGVEVALPSVAPDMRILSYETSPKIPVQFDKDGADNFYVRTEEAYAHGTYRLVFYVDANAGYFAPSLPRTPMRVRDVAKAAPPELKVTLPPDVEREANVTLGKLGIDRDMDLGVVFNRLVGYFRGFTPKTIDNPSGNTYRDLCDNQAGVCRHRSFAFMITANEIGIPTRFVSNEAHAFVEVWFPERGWQRIDLGGASPKLEVSNGKDKTLHRPRAADPFAKPDSYRNMHTQLAGDITDQQVADRDRPLDQAPPSGSFGPGPGSGSGSGSGSLAGAGSDDPNNRISPNPGLPAVAPNPAKPTPRLAITLADSHAYRGDAIHVEGLANIGQKPLADHVVDIYIAPAGGHGRQESFLGYAKTAADGTFRVDLAVPAELKLQTYELYVSSPEDAYYNAALSD